MANELLKASSLSEQQLRRSAKKLADSMRKVQEDEHMVISNLHAYLKLNGTGAASRLCEKSGIARARLSEVASETRKISLDMARRIAGLK